jgi:hypothetical protein
MSIGMPSMRCSSTDMLLDSTRRELSIVTHHDVDTPWRAFDDGVMMRFIRYCGKRIYNALDVLTEKHNCQLQKLKTCKSNFKNRESWNEIESMKFRFEDR